MPGKTMTAIRSLVAASAVLVLVCCGAPQPAPTPQPTPSAPIPVGSLFATSDSCAACHNWLTAPKGEDISVGTDWRPTMMANSARDPYWHASVTREVRLHPPARAVIEDACASCHMPMSRYEAKSGGRTGEVFANLPIGESAAPAAHLAADGTSCTVCHQITADKLGTRESFSGGFTVQIAQQQGSRRAFGPFPVDNDHVLLMRAASGYEPVEAAHIRQSEVCATCHMLITTTLGPDSKPIGELPEQVPYLEWRHSAYPATQSCLTCHMPAVDAAVAISSVLGVPRSGVRRHEFLGGNVLMPRILDRFRQQLGVVALPQELDASLQRQTRYLQSQAAAVTIAGARLDGRRLQVDVVVENRAGHKLPSAYPSRRAWLHVTVRDARGRIVFESGAVRPDGSIQGNDNDADASRYEPHYTEIDAADKVQIYESVMTDPAGAVTTVLLSGVRYVKDNRLLPRGFDKATADKDIAVLGAAATDADFTGGQDTVRYSADVADSPGPFRVQAELLYQPIGYRWAQNLRAEKSPEADRFVSYYEALASSSWVRLARGETTVPSRTGAE